MKALVVPDIDGDPGSVAGAIQFCEWHNQPGVIAGLSFRCPCGCGREGFLPLDRESQGPSWEWNGDLERPTLSPSVQQVGGCKWHGFLRNGEWVQA